MEKAFILKNAFNIRLTRTNRNGIGGTPTLPEVRILDRRGSVAFQVATVIRILRLYEGIQCPWGVRLTGDYFLEQCCGNYCMSLSR